MIKGGLNTPTKCVNEEEIKTLLDFLLEAIVDKGFTKETKLTELSQFVVEFIGKNQGESHV